MKMFFRDLLLQSCFIDKKGAIKKKVDDNKAIFVKEGGGKPKKSKVKSEAEVEPTICELRYLGVGLPRVHPEAVIEIGDGNPYKKGRRKS